MRWVYSIRMNLWLDSQIQRNIDMNVFRVKWTVWNAWVYKFSYTIFVLIIRSVILSLSLSPSIPLSLSLFLIRSYFQYEGLYQYTCRMSFAICLFPFYLSPFFSITFSLCDMCRLYWNAQFKNFFVVSLLKTMSIMKMLRPH